MQTSYAYLEFILGAFLKNKDIYYKDFSNFKKSLLEKFYKLVSKLYQNQYVFTDSGIIFTGSRIILILVYGIFPIGVAQC